MKRIFSRKRRDYRLYAAALAFGFTATLATLLFSSPEETASQDSPTTVEHTASSSTNNNDVVAFAYASEDAGQSSAGIFQPIVNMARGMHSASDDTLKPISKRRYSNAGSTKPLSMTEVVSINKGDTLDQVFETFSIPKNIAAEAISSLKGIFSPRHFRIGQQITLLFKPDEDGGRVFQGYRFAADSLRDVIIMDDSGSGSFGATVIEKELTTSITGKQGVITGSLIDAARRAGVPHKVISEMIRVYSYSVDFQRDIQEGDRFEVMYEAKVDKDGQTHGTGDMMYARLTLSGKEYPLYRYEGKDGNVDFYKADGTSNRRGLIRTPIDGARMSSGFGMRRHPVLGYSKMHKGTDFAAPTGTPIYAAGDGVVVKASWFSSYGRYVKIKHNSNLSTAYAHMSRFAKNMRPGARVKQGQVIGYVGTSGRSTGAHLHYEVLMNNVQVNPVGVKVPTASQLAGNELHKFKNGISGIEKQFKQALAKGNKTVASR